MEHLITDWEIKISDCDANYTARADISNTFVIFSFDLLRPPAARWQRRGEAA